MTNRINGEPLSQPASERHSGTFPDRTMAMMQAKRAILARYGILTITVDPQLLIATVKFTPHLSEKLRGMPPARPDLSQSPPLWIWCIGG